MIVGIGVDLCAISRINDAMSRHGDCFPKRILAPKEFAELNRLNHSMKAAFLAKRFAAKEAVAKALGTGIGRGFGFRDVTITHDELGRPAVVLNTENASLSATAQYRTHLSISDERTHVIAFCTIESN
ncbi:MAG: holo-ACP synthase [Litorivicinaceae bacterium]|nr:holo-ACP synthase [Gammaproteobacteria bacterium]RPG22553.1 MAG: holo-ACP synthase [Oceanospirillales bacterium TMED33]RZO77134.1 MAG: holo-ACP synthase [Litorivicinaceae bacterium]CAI8393319.1 MAG: Holo-[acyl-carrier-protein] synthase [Gammaproteobacteria bacterium]|tara:strand:- start:240 stop:623 length:384 start_codon:yes stop_codon:yes gene_type:complete